MTRLSTQRRVLGLVSWLLMAYAASAIGAVASINAREFYSQLRQPSFAPPGWVFGPVWTTLYTLMGVAAWLVWREGGFARHRPALTLFILQLAVNALWSWLFFAWHRGAGSFADILLLWVLIVATLILFWRARPAAGMLLIPYLLWVSFAAVLNYTIWQLNPSQL